MTEFDKIVGLLKKENVSSVSILGDCNADNTDIEFKDIAKHSEFDINTPKQIGEKSQWLISLNYGGKFNKKMEKNVFNYIDKNTILGVFLSWNSNENSINNRDNNYVKTKMAKLGYTNDLELEKELNGVMAFRKIQFNTCDNYITNKFPHSAVLSEQHIKNCKMVTDRYTLIDKLGLNKDSKICEVGVFNGDYSKEIIRRINPTELHLVDMNETVQLTNVIKENKCIKFFKGDSLSIMEKFEDETFDYIYIDADHTYNWVFHELSLAKNKIKKGGLIGCNDYIFYDHYANMKYGIVEAVNEFCVQNDFEIVFFAFHVQMFCDVVLRKI